MPHFDGFQQVGPAMAFLVVFSVSPFNHRWSQMGMGHTAHMSVEYGWATEKLLSCFTSPTSLVASQHFLTWG